MATKKAKPGVTGFLFRENRGWVFVTTEKVTPTFQEMVTEGWRKVSDLPILVFESTELLIDSDGKVRVQEVTLAE